YCASTFTAACVSASSTDPDAAGACARAGDSSFVLRSENSVFADAPGPGVHSALTAAAASAAAAGVGAATPRKLPSRTTTVPGIASAALVVALERVEPYAGGRTIRACSIWSRAISEL